MSEHELGHKPVGLEGVLKIPLVNSDRYPHQHVLGSLHYFAVNFQKVSPLQSFEPEEVVVKITLIIDDLLDLFVTLHED